MPYVGKHRKIWEVFDPRSGKVWFKCRDEQKAARLAHIHGFDYEQEGVGWLIKPV